MRSTLFLLAAALLVGLGALFVLSGEQRGFAAPLIVTGLLCLGVSRLIERPPRQRP